MGELT